MRRFCTVILLLLCMAVVNARADLQIHFLDVGQGDAAIILCDGESLMIDGGEPGKSQFVYNYLKNTLALTHIDYLVASHPHSDHVGGLAAALNACGAGVLYAPSEMNDARIPESKAWSSLLKYAGTIYRVPKTGDRFNVGSATATFLYADCSDEDINNWSLILKVTYGNTSFLFVGDAESGEEQALLDRGVDLRATVLKVGHHGSNSSSTKQFLRAVRPSCAVISVGAGNDYGHPDESVLRRLRNAGATIYRTDQAGTIVCTSDGTAVSFNAAGEAAPSGSLWTSIDWADYGWLIYFLLINLTGFLISLIVSILHKRTKNSKADAVQGIAAALGGTVGVLLGMLLFERSIRDSHEEQMLTVRVLLACVALLQLLAILFASGMHKSRLTIAFWLLFTRHRPILTCMIILNAATFIAYCTDLLSRLVPKQRRRTIVLLILAYIGGAPAAAVSVLALKHRNGKRYFTLGVPAMLVTQIVLWLFLVNLRGM